MTPTGSASAGGSAGSAAAGGSRAWKLPSSGLVGSGSGATRERRLSRAAYAPTAPAVQVRPPALIRLSMYGVRPSFQARPFSPLLSITVQAHPYRREMAETLAAAIGADVTWDPEPEERPSAWRTYRRALETTPQEASWRLIIQDDAQPCRYLPEAAAAATASLDGLLCLFVQGSLYGHIQAIDDACREDRTLTVLPPVSWVPTVATIWPTAVIPAALEWVDQQGWPYAFNADDEIVGRLTRALGIPVYATVPSLVDHPDDVASLVGSRQPMFGGNRDRVAHCYIGDDADPRGIRWSL